MIKQVVVYCLLALFLAPIAHASDATNQKARALLTYLAKKQPKKILAAPLLNFSVSPQAPVQNQNVSVFIQPDNTFPSRDLSLDVKVNGESKAVSRPSKHLFVLPLGLLTESRTYNLEATLYLENTQENTSIRDAIKALDRDITRLTNQINNERDPVKRKILQSQREEKVALKTELLEQLKKFRVKAGTQNYAFELKPSVLDPALPKVFTLSPTAGLATGGDTVTFSGENFTPNFTALFGGVASPSVTYVNETTVQAVTPNMFSAGAKNVELRFSTAEGVKNVVMNSGFFALLPGNGPVENVRPVAVASGSQKIRLGETAQLDAYQSYDSNGSTLAYRWTVVSVPANSNFYVGQELGGAAAITLNPSAHGTYVVQLIVKENTAQALESEPSLAVVEVSANPAPTVSGPIQVNSGEAASVQVYANNPQAGNSNYFSVRQAPAFGQLSLSNSGLVTYIAPNQYVGATYAIVRVTDQTGLYGEVTIPIQVSSNNVAPQPTAPSIATAANTAGTSQINPNDPNAIDQHTYEISIEPMHGDAVVSSTGLVTYTPDTGFGGTDTLQVRVTDNGSPSLSAFVNIAVTVNRAPVPTAAGFSVSTNGVKTTQVFPNDPDSSQTHSYTITTQGTKGTATVSAAGVVTYTAGAVAGSDSFQVRVTDSGTPALEGFVSVPVTVVASNQSPIAGTFSYTIRSRNLPVTAGLALSGFSDPDGSISEVRFNPGDGTTEFAPLTGPNIGFVLHGYHAYGTYTGTATVKDNLGAETSVPLTVNIVNADLPTAKFSLNVISGSAPLTVTANASAATGPNTFTSYRWLWGDGSPEEINAGYVTRSHTYNTPGTYRIRLRIRDSVFAQGESFATVYVGVSPPAGGSPPHGDFTVGPKREVLVNTPVNFDASRSFDANPSGSISSYAWNYEDFSSCGNGCTGTGLTSSHTYTLPTTFFPFVVTTNAGGNTSASARIEVNNVLAGKAPRPAYTFNGINWFTSNIVGTAPFQVNFSAAPSFDYDGTITAYDWTFGDGGSASGPVSSYTYATPGVYFVTLKTTDNDGNFPVLIRMVTVNPSFTALDEGGEGEDETKNNLAAACGRENGEACYHLARIYESEGNSFVMEKLLERACSLGFQDACSMR